MMEIAMKSLFHRWFWNLVMSWRKESFIHFELDCVWYNEEKAKEYIFLVVKNPDLKVDRLSAGKSLHLRYIWGLWPRENKGRLPRMSVQSFIYYHKWFRPIRRTRKNVFGFVVSPYFSKYIPLDSHKTTYINYS